MHMDGWMRGKQAEARRQHRDGGGDASVCGGQWAMASNTCREVLTASAAVIVRTIID